MYQVNLTRQLAAPIADDADVAALGAALAIGNPAPYAAVVRVPSAGLHVASASPERYLRREGRLVWSSPIKGTAATPDAFLAKDRAENVMIVDLVRNDLGRVCDFGSVCVPALLAVEHHPGLVHLVSTVAGELRRRGRMGRAAGRHVPARVDHRARRSWRRWRSSAGSSRWRGASTAVASGGSTPIAGIGELNVAIRTFWIDPDGERGPVLRFGTGGGITHDSEPSGEWAETVLKARTLLAVASG